MLKFFSIAKTLLIVSLGFVAVVVVLMFIFNGFKLKPVRVGLSWLNQGQFAGMYVADAEGFYRDEGIIVHCC